MNKLYNERRFNNFREIIDSSAALFPKSDAFIIKKALIDLRKDQYIIKNAFRNPVELN